MLKCKAVKISLVAAAVIGLLASSIAFPAGSSKSTSSKYKSTSTRSKGTATVKSSSTKSIGSQYGRGTSKMVRHRRAAAYRRAHAARRYRTSYAGTRYGRGPAKKAFYTRRGVCPPGYKAVRRTHRTRVLTTAQRRAALAAAAKRRAEMRAAGTTTPAGRGPGIIRQGVQPPTGAGPTPSMETMMANMAKLIQQRGYVTNMAEAWVMMQSMVQQNGGVKDSGDYRVAYILDKPEGWYVMQDNNLTWMPPAAGENQHIEAVVMDALTGQVLPIIPTVDVLDASGNSVQSKTLMFLWHPLADHYGANFIIPSAGTYSLHITGPVPDIGRHDQTRGKRFTTPVDVTFTGVQITPKAATPPVGAGPAVQPPSGLISPPAGAGSTETPSGDMDKSAPAGAGPSTSPSGDNVQPDSELQQ